MLDKLALIYNRWKEIELEMNDPANMADMKRFIKLSKDYKDLQPIVDAYLEYADIHNGIESTRQILYNTKDEDFREMAKEELNLLTKRKEVLEEDIRLLLIPQDPQDGKNAILEIRAGTGGDEASIFAGDLFRMYMKYAEVKGWKLELVDYTEGTAGGYKEVIANVTGDGVYGLLKYESGVH